MAPASVEAPAFMQGLSQKLGGYDSTAHSHQIDVWLRPLQLLARERSHSGAPKSMEKKLSKYVKRAKQPEYLRRYSKCFTSISQAEEAFAFHRYSDCVASLYDAMDYFWKALRHLQVADSRNIRDHMPRLETWNSFMPQLVGSLLTPSELTEMEELFSKYNPVWDSNPPDRHEARYDDKRFDAHRSLRQLEDVERLIPRVLAGVRRRVYSMQGKLTFGVLDGYFGLDKQTEIACDWRPWAGYSGAGPRGWLDELRDSAKADCRLVSITDISPEFGVILNPFGEAYPELPSTRDLTPAYQMIKDFTYAGGIFITAAGNPFHYLFNVRDGTHHDTGSVVPNIPVSLQEVPDGSGRIQVKVVTLLVDSLLNRDFGVRAAFLGDRYLPPHTSDLFQQTEDRTFWNCEVEVNQIQVFRPLYPNQDGNPAPILRAVIGEQEVIPIGIVRFGTGLLLHVGLPLDEGNNKEFELAVSVVKHGLIENYDNYFL